MDPFKAQLLPLYVSAVPNTLDFFMIKSITQSPKWQWCMIERDIQPNNIPSVAKAFIQTVALINKLTLFLQNMWNDLTHIGKELGNLDLERNSTICMFEIIFKLDYYNRAIQSSFCTFPCFMEIWKCLQPICCVVLLLLLEGTALLRRSRYLTL